jgi:hypothetical protein
LLLLSREEGSVSRKGHGEGGVEEGRVTVKVRCISSFKGRRERRRERSRRKGIKGRRKNVEEGRVSGKETCQGRKDINN